MSTDALKSLAFPSVLRVGLALFLLASASWTAAQEERVSIEDVAPAEEPPGIGKVVDLAARDGEARAPGATFEDAMRLYDAKRLDEAQVILERLARDNPQDAKSRGYLKSIISMKRKQAEHDQNTVERDRILDVRRAWLPLERPSEASRDPRKRALESSQTREMEKKLRQVIPEINFTDANLRDVIAYLSKISGINIILDENTSLKGEEDLEEIEAGKGDGATDKSGGAGMSGRVTIALENLPLGEVLKYILYPAGLKFRVDKYAIMIATPSRLDSSDMETRYYNLSSGSSTFVAVRKTRAVAGEGTETEVQANLTIKDVLEQSGVPFPEGSKVFLDARTGTLIARNTSSNLAEIENILGALDVTPFQVAIEAKFVDIAESTARELGLETFLRGDFPLTFGGQGIDPNLVIQESAGNSQFGQFTSSTVANQGFSRGLGFLTDSAGVPAGNIFSFASILTQPKLQVILHALDQSGMANILSAPKITTANNEQARIKVVTEIFYPTEFEITPATTNDNGGVTTPPIVIPGGFTSRDIGISLEVTPSVGADKKTINLTLLPEVSTLSAWVDFGISVGANFPAIPILQPVFTSKNVTASIVINDTETVVLGGLIKDTTSTTEDKVPILGDLPFFGGPFRSSTTVSEKKNLLIFVTAYLLSPEGDNINGPYYSKSKIFNP